jgi:hypothetical protein
MMARAEIVARDGSFGGARAVTWLTLAWVAAILVAAAAKALRRGPERAHAS